jgi:hypothetical protein
MVQDETQRNARFCDFTKMTWTINGALFLEDDRWDFLHA